jgi:DNA polymerase-4
VSYNKFLAKLASDQNKPDGLCVIRPGQGARFVATLPVRRFSRRSGHARRGKDGSGWGSRPGQTCARRTSIFLRQHFGIAGGLSLPRRAGDRPAPGAGPTGRASRSGPSARSTRTSRQALLYAKCSTGSSS